MHTLVRTALAVATGVALSFSVTVAAELPAGAAPAQPVPATGDSGPVTAGAVDSAQRASAGRATVVVSPAVQRSLTVESAGSVQKAVASKGVSARRGSSRGGRALAFARRQVGDRYRWGANGPNSWDCSGLTQGAWRAAGVRLPHNARAQFHRGRKVSRGNLRPGDLVFFYRGIRHVGIYAGNGKIIHAPGRGKRVRVAKLSHMPYQGARRMG